MKTGKVLYPEIAGGRRTFFVSRESRSVAMMLSVVLIVRLVTWTQTSKSIEEAGAVHARNLRKHVDINDVINILRINMKYKV